MDLIQRLEDVEQKIEQWPAQIKQDATIFMFEELTKVLLSRLLTMNPDTKRQSDYQAGLTALG